MAILWIKYLAAQNNTLLPTTYNAANAAILEVNCSPHPIINSQYPQNFNFINYNQTAYDNLFSYKQTFYDKFCQYIKKFFNGKQQNYNFVELYNHQQQDSPQAIAGTSNSAEGPGLQQETALAISNINNVFIKQAKDCLNNAKTPEQVDICIKNINQYLDEARSNNSNENGLEALLKLSEAIKTEKQKILDTGEKLFHDAQEPQKTKLELNNKINALKKYAKDNGLTDLEIKANNMCSDVKFNRQKGTLNSKKNLFNRKKGTFICLSSKETEIDEKLSRLSNNDQRKILESTTKLQEHKNLKKLLERNSIDFNDFSQYWARFYCPLEAKQININTMSCQEIINFSDIEQLSENAHKEKLKNRERLDTINNKPTYLQQLGFDKNGNYTKTQIQEQYKKLSRECHTDKIAGKNDCPSSSAEINNAYQKLMTIY
jgi:hypothetical protein